MANNSDLIFIRHVVGDDIDAKTVDPVIVQLVIFTRDASPVDRPIRLDMFLDDIEFGVDLGRDQECVIPFAANHYIIRDKRLILPSLQLLARFIDLIVRVAARWFPNCQLADALLTCVRARDQKVVASTA